ncbi:hypothetical protein FisN_1Hh550 [Fistulifera solaris]|uniref:Uncharacterized protein n=1 Tax=Fistulifera solaris TaxID=1519565 RepID=A0A1Z5KQS7_FISSO|nr:hypothetical protein FisN_1Hh550 [Fistulifera solaris]|eukprot:GAX28656.1 hypothetical protein FisN_1Hh550 [Fistulifera solaris]
MISSILRKAARPVSASFTRTAVCAFSSNSMASGDNVIVPLIANSLEFLLSSPPPVHQFQESPIVVETDHLTLYPGKEAEEVLAMQGHEVTDVIGKEKWVQNDPAKYEGLIPQNAEWTEFIDEKTGETVYLDEFGDRVTKA